MISSLIMLELIPACSSCNNNLNLSQSSLGSDGKNVVLETPETKIVILVDLSNFISVRSRVDFLPVAFTSKYVSFAKSYNNFFIR